MTQPDGRLAFGILRTDYLIEMQKSINFGRKGHSMIVDHQGRVRGIRDGVVSKEVTDEHLFELNQVAFGQPG